MKGHLIIKGETLLSTWYEWVMWPRNLFCIYFCSWSLGLYLSVCIALIRSFPSPSTCISLILSLHFHSPPFDVNFLFVFSTTLCHCILIYLALLFICYPVFELGAINTFLVFLKLFFFQSTCKCREYKVGKYTIFVSMAAFIIWNQLSKIVF